MSSQRPKILLIGSYSGQDSFGDKCLLKSVTTQLSAVLPNPEFITHIDQAGQEESNAWFSEGVTFRGGMVVAYNNWRNRLRHLKLPFEQQSRLAMKTFDLGMRFAPAWRTMADAAKRDIDGATLVYFYGGTQLSGQWFWHNFPSLLLTVQEAARAGVPVYFGPQQYGPLPPADAQLLRETIRKYVKGVRTRNTLCAKMLQLAPESLVLDEVYSCRKRYPLVEAQPTPGDHLLVNCRAINFQTDTEVPELDTFARMAGEIATRMQLPVKVLQMSGASFSDDTLIVESFRKHWPQLPVEVIPYALDDLAVVEASAKARATFSMSFHCCVLSLLAGRPAIPVSSGAYYEHKYTDFPRYAGMQESNAVFLGEMKTPEIMQRSIDNILRFYNTYQAEQTASARRKAAEELEGWYSNIGKAAQH
jgi:hypothetical protein